MHKTRSTQAQCSVIVACCILSSDSSPPKRPEYLVLETLMILAKTESARLDIASLACHPDGISDDIDALEAGMAIQPLRLLLLASPSTLAIARMQKDAKEIGIDTAA